MENTGKNRYSLSLDKSSGASSYVTGLCHNGTSSIATILSTNQVLLIDAETTDIKKTVTLHGECTGINFDNNVCRIVDSSKRLFTIDDRTEDVSVLPFSIGDHVPCSSAFNASQIAVGTRGKTDPAGDGDDDDEDSYAVWLFDSRNLHQLMVEGDAHSDSITSLAFTADGFLLSGASDSLFNVIDPNGIEDRVVATVSVESPISKIGTLPGSLIYTISDDSKLSILKMNAPDDVDIISRRRVSRDRFLVDVFNTSLSDYPIGAIETTPEGDIFVIGLSSTGSDSTVLAHTKGVHSDVVRCAAWNDGTLFTGGEDGVMAATAFDFRPSAGKAIRKEAIAKTRATPY